MGPNENQGLIIELPEDAAAAAAGWLPPEDEAEKVETKEAKKANGNGHAKSDADSDAVATIKRERDEALARLSRVEQESRSEIEAREARLAEAEKKAGDNQYYAARAHYDKIHGDAAQIDTAMRAQQQYVEIQKKEYIAAREAGDSAREIAAQEAIAEAKAAIVQLEAGRSGLEPELARAKHIVAQIEQGAAREPQRKEVKAEPKDEPKAPTKEQWLSNLGVQTSAKVVDWMKSHPEFMEDPKLHQKWLAFTNAYATVDEKDLRGDDFLEALNGKFFPSSNNEDDDMEEDEPEVKVEAKKKAPPGAPVSRNGGDFYSSKNPSGRKLRLHPRLVNAAKEIGSDPQVYAENIKKMIGEGKYPKNYLDWDYQDNLG